MTGRSVPEWIGKTPDTPIPPRVRARVFARFHGICYKSRRVIRAGDAWQCDHVVALINGGRHAEDNLAPILAEQHKLKTADDMSEKSKTARIHAKHFGLFPKSRYRIRSKGFPKREMA